MSNYAPGTIVLFSSGEYSDYGYCGQVVTLRECNFLSLAQEYKDQYKAEDEWDTPGPDGFVAWLCANQYVAALDCSELHIGSYGELEVRP